MACAASRSNSPSLEEESVVFFKLLTEDAQPPVKGSTGATAYDLTTNMEVVLPRGKPVKIGTGVAVSMFQGNIYATIDARSSTIFRHSIIIIRGLIDADYTGELFVVAVYVGENESYILPSGSKVAQLLFHSTVKPALIPTIHLKCTERGENGFGSTDEERSAAVFTSFPSNQMQAIEEGYLTDLTFGTFAYRYWFIDPPLSKRES